ncbi:30S ribosomal protein S11 [Patescibacteria group bacterium]|nr:30S ribosomal protein S11 [Patescibacteria group bacterium]MBU1200168.1 30S ribosomal protein S11 [Patescibacteria group bacterium]MBU1256186.1 30S ribosomal protein S11 [Patescibacteria group bacterium]MBU1457720.1 30S ribosomal protein S11 [Patescibacteria group bacterium]
MATKKIKDTIKSDTKKVENPRPKVRAKKTAPFFRSGQGCMYVSSTFNTTRVTFTDLKGNVISWSTAGTCGFKGSKRSTPFAATTIIEEGLRKAKANGLNSVDVYLKGPGTGKDAAIRVLKTSGLDINLLADITPIPHNGCRPKKPRRV